MFSSFYIKSFSFCYLLPNSSSSSSSVGSVTYNDVSTGNNAFKSPEDFKVSLPLRTNYLYGRIKKSLPEMYAFTVCMWLKSTASPGIGTPFSYGVPGQANEIVLIEWGNNPIELLVNDKVGTSWETNALLIRGER